jgi:hypothetical protein
MTATQAPTGLPTAKRAPRAGVGKVWIYGDAGIGKSTTAIEAYPDDGYTMDTEGSTTALEGFIEDIGSWELFLRRIAELAKGEHAFQCVTIDTVDVLANFCGDYTLKDEFALRIAKLCAVVPNVIFVSHATTETVKQRNGVERQVQRPELAPKGLRSWLEGFVDHICFAEIDVDGNRILRTQPSADYLAKTRVPRGQKPPADPMAMRGPVLRKALEKLGGGS